MELSTVAFTHIKVPHHVSPVIAETSGIRKDTTVRHMICSRGFGRPMKVAKRFGIGTLGQFSVEEDGGVLREAKDLGYIQPTNDSRVKGSMGILEFPWSCSPANE